MSIPDRIAKAETDLAALDFENALIQALIAVAATSRKRYPTGRDKAAFEKFLQDELGPNIQSNISIRGGYIKLLYDGKMERLEHILYKFVRCSFFHEAGVPPRITVVPAARFYVHPAPDTLEIGYGMVEIFVRIVKNAPENATLFTTPFPSS